MAKMYLSHKLSFFFCILLVSLVVNSSFWSSNSHQVMALRNIHFGEELQVIEQIIKPYVSSCGKSCTSHEYCQTFKHSPCTQCRLASKRATVWKCHRWK
ncbi:hypothetical protein H5410_063661 [Solanum commersonii]|uniref:Uncharacterized protein n=1 Tax=Solanum commersonii TaxID=4109 RepID=A0A9J5WEY2_SOLCO|nr:hypothetical protein H5410_063661 [Solanum commersonii]